MKIITWISGNELTQNSFSQNQLNWFELLADKFWWVKETMIFRSIE
jgi:hypothetical protein